LRGVGIEKEAWLEPMGRFSLQKEAISGYFLINFYVMTKNLLPSHTSSFLNMPVIE
jgi:hypothetical protein